jgi:hypothetical protein
VQQPVGLQLAGLIGLDELMYPAGNLGFARSRDELRVTIAGVTTAIRSCERDIGLGVRGPTAKFVDQTAPPDITLDVAWAVPPDDAPGTLQFDSGGVWQLHRDGERLVFRLSSPKFGPLPYKTATMAEDFATGVVHLHRPCFTSPGFLYPLDYPLDELLLTNWLALGRGVEVHACAVVDRDDRGYLFAGHSGAGKTTLARQWLKQTGVSVLSDDRVVLRNIDGQIWMYGTPWHGDEPLASPARARLTRGFFLGHALSNRVAEVTGATAVAKLLVRSFPPFASATGLGTTVTLLSEIVQRIPFLDFGFVPTPAVRDIVRNLQ